MSSRQLWMAALVTAVAVRLLTLSAYPLHDTTEARYAEIARLMVVSGDWIMPQIEPGVPFWGKPPLSIWLTAASFKLLGFSEFAARLPAFLLTLVTAVLTFRIGKKLYSEKAALAACVILVTSMLGFVASGAVMTDAALMFATTLSLVSFCLTVRDSTPFGRYGFFVGLGLGLLAKGPIALVLVGVPTLVWSLWQKNLSWLWRALPWGTGTIVMLAITGPWYLLAEINSPGFLEYFLVGEHWLRFVESGWQGDLYGSAHARPHGTILIYAIAAALPWSIIALYAGVQALKGKSPLRSLTPIQAYLLLWTLTPLVFFYVCRKYSRGIRIARYARFRTSAWQLGRESQSFISARGLACSGPDCYCGRGWVLRRCCIQVTARPRRTSLRGIAIVRSVLLPEIAAVREFLFRWSGRSDFNEVGTPQVSYLGR